MTERKEEAQVASAILRIVGGGRIEPKEPLRGLALLRQDAHKRAAVEDDEEVLWDEV